MPRANESKPYALLAEFESAEQLVAAAKATVEAGYRKLDAYSPYPIDELPPALTSRLIPEQGGHELPPRCVAHHRACSAERVRVTAARVVPQ
jgi:hypothetical protein